MGIFLTLLYFLLKSALFKHMLSICFYKDKTKLDRIINNINHRIIYIRNYKRNQKDKKNCSASQGLPRDAFLVKLTNPYDLSSIFLNIV